MANLPLAEGQKYEGGAFPSGLGSIYVVGYGGYPGSADFEPVFSYFYPDVRHGDGSGSSDKATVFYTDISVPMTKARDYRPYVYWYCAIVSNNAENNAKYKDIVYVDPEYAKKLAKREKFFTAIKTSLFVSFTQGQIDGLNSLFDAFEQYPELTAQEKAYMLATVYHECAKTMQPIEEYGKGAGRDYGTWFTNSNGQQYSWTGPSKTTAYFKSEYPFLYYARGYVQLTWYVNYEKAKGKLGVDFVSKPQLALSPEHAAKIMILGMTEGWFTGRKLSNYITPTQADYFSARAIINGTDRAQLIADYAVKFESALQN